jgi:hypothetical protein
MYVAATCVANLDRYYTRQNMGIQRVTIDPASENIFAEGVQRKTEWLAKYGDSELGGYWPVSPKAT